MADLDTAIRAELDRRYAGFDVDTADAIRAVLDVLNGYALSPAHSGIVAELRAEIAQELGVKP